MVTQGNETCIELHGVTQSGFSSSSSSPSSADTRRRRNMTICVKGTWYPSHFLLLITDGIDAWRMDATENVVTLRSRSLRLAETEYVDKAHLLLGQQHSSSVYSLHRISSETVQLMCTTPTDKQQQQQPYNALGFSLDLVLKMVPTASVIAFDMLQFVMRSHTELVEQMQSMMRMLERTKAAREKEKQEVESQLLQQKTAAVGGGGGWDNNNGAVAMIAAASLSSPAAAAAAAMAKRKLGEHEDAVQEKRSARKKKPLPPQWSLPSSTSPPPPPPLLPAPPSASKAAPPYSNGIKGMSNSGSKAAARRQGGVGAVTIPTTKISNNSKQSISEPPKSGSWGVQGKFFVGAAGPSEEEDDDDEQTAEEEEEETDKERQQEMIMAAANVEACLEGSQFPEHHYRLMMTTTAHPGRRSLGGGGATKGNRSTIVKRASSGSKLKKGGARSSSVRRVGEVIHAEQIEEQVAKGIEMLAPFTNSGSPCGHWDGEERNHQQRPISSRKRATKRQSGSGRKSGKQSSEKKKNVIVGSLHHSSSQTHNSAQVVSPWPNVSSLQGMDAAQQLGMLLDNNHLGIVPVTQEQRKFNVVSADVNDFDGDRTEKVMALNQFWALYDDKDGMPRFYGRISKLVHSPFEVNVEWLEPHRPVVRPSGLVKSANLSVSCGEFKLGIECPQSLAAFSHRVEMDVDAPKSIFRLYPKKHEVWALYRNWSKPKPEPNDAEEEEDNVKFEYELVEVQNDYSKEKGVKVIPLYKVPGFTALFKSGGPQVVSSVIPAKDVFSQFSHRIFTYQMHGNEKPGVPKGSRELDPAATPLEYLKQSTNGYSDGVYDSPDPEIDALQTVSESG
ncbi:unnamed protein product [Sphagnum compactum]